MTPHLVWGPSQLKKIYDPTLSVGTFPVKKTLSLLRAQIFQ